MKVFDLYDFIYFPLYVLLFSVLLFFFHRTSRLSYELKAKIIIGFWVRVLYVIAFFLLQQFYFHGGDSFAYYVSVKDLHEMSWSMKQGFVTSPTSVVSIGSGLFTSFSDIMGYLNSNVSNAAVVKITYWLSFLCGTSYLTICFFFSMFAFAGCVRIYVLFTRYYPKLYREFALCALFMPSVCFWSSGLLKDSISLGAMGFLVSACHGLLVDKKRKLFSLLQILFFGYMILIIKPYILLALTPGLLIWIFRKMNFKNLTKSFRNVITVGFVIAGGLIGFLLLGYFSSTEYAKDLRTDNLTDRIAEIRDVYASSDEQKGASHFDVGTDNPILSLPLGMVATLFRPFPWEARNFNMFFSALEALAFLLLTGFIFFKLGFFKTMRQIFKNGELTFFFIFSVIFASAVGSSTPNFGTLVRYKIPCLPYYFMMLFIIMYVAKLNYPKWLKFILGMRKKWVRPATPLHKIQRS